MTDYKAVKLMRNGCAYNFPKWWKDMVDVLIVGGGWAGGSTCGACVWWGGWAWWFVECMNVELDRDAYYIKIWWGWVWVSGCNGRNWWNSYFGDKIIAYWWGWGAYSINASNPWGSWWWMWNYITGSINIVNGWEWRPIWLQGHNWWYWVTCCAIGAWWWWAGWPWGMLWWWHNWIPIFLPIWWVGRKSDINWEVYAVWGSGTWINTCALPHPQNYTSCWSWWDAWNNGTNTGCSGKWWIVVIRYPTECWYDFVWGTKTTSGDYTIHTFTSSGFFGKNISSQKTFRYMVIGWGWGGWWGSSSNYVWWGWGAWAVCDGYFSSIETCFPISVGSWWVANGNGGASEISGIVTAAWWKAGNNSCGGASWGWNEWWGRPACTTWVANWWGWGALFNWWAWAVEGSWCWWYWWMWIVTDITWQEIAIAWWGWGAGMNYTSNNYYIWNWVNTDFGGGRWWAYNTSPTSGSKYWAGGGWASWYCASYRTSCPGYQWVVVISYPSDWSFGFSSATWGNCCYLCNGNCIHIFTSNGTFCIVS